MYVRLSVALAALLTVPSTAAPQASLRVEPLRVAVNAPSQASAITLQNTSADKIGVQMRVFEWSQTNGTDTLKPTTDVVVSPPATTIPSGASYTVRIARTAGGKVPRRERSTSASGTTCRSSSAQRTPPPNFLGRHIARAAA